WMKYDSDRAHPRKHDVGVIHLDEKISLASYPKVVGEKSSDGAKATRVRNTTSGFQQIDMALAKVRSSPNAFLTDFQAGEALDTGGAVYDSRGILGIVSGRGITSGKLYVARVDGLVKWLAPKVACAGAATGIRTYAGPASDKSNEICEDAGAGTSSSGGGDNTTSGGPNGGGDNGGTCEGDDDGVCSGNCGSSGSNGSNGPSNPGGDGTPGSSGAPGSDGSSGNTGSNPGGDGTPGAGGTGGSDGSSNPGGDGTPGSSGAPGSNGSSGNDGNTNNGGPSGGAGGSEGTVPSTDNGGDSDEACQGPNDNPEVCPPEPDGCVGPSCGGGQPDDSIDYGNCACGSSGGDSIYLR
ncbi:MAG: hypothetical protein K0S65_4185, partial [Labilithrix sp.]|nr:hypothetical protein [Labilithrix sp.]